MTARQISLNLNTGWDSNEPAVFRHLWPVTARDVLMPTKSRHIQRTSVRARDYGHVLCRVLIIIALPGMLIAGGCNRLPRVSADEKGAGTSAVSVAPYFSPKERLGKLLFFERSLSTPPGQACSNCHAPQVAFADPETELPVSRGALPFRYGNRNDMTVSYSAFVPPLRRDEEEGIRNKR